MRLFPKSLLSHTLVKPNILTQINDSLIINTSYSPSSTLSSPENWQEFFWAQMESTAPAVVQGNTSWEMTQFMLLPQARLPPQPRTTLYIRNQKWNF